ncbi:cell wall integrity and stress response component [Microdochium nivale]|nr:cell wall integrity and stress response component [Microdochium nivale]
MKAFALLPVLATAAAAKEALGCYSLSLAEAASNIIAYASYGSCRHQCSVEAQPYAGLQGNKCACFNELPPASGLVADDQCNTPCPGFSPEICGGKDAWIVLETKPELDHSSLTLANTASATQTPSGVYSISANATHSATGTSSTAVIPTAAAVAGSASLAGVAAAALVGLGFVGNMFEV